MRAATSTTPHVAMAPSTNPALRLARRLHLDAWWVSGPILLYVLLVLGGVTQSSIGTAHLREDASHPTGIMLGSAVNVRADEYLTTTPLAIGVTASGIMDDLNPLTAPQGFTTMLASGPASSVVLFDGTILRLGTFLPDQMLLAARWWLPFLLLVLGAPSFFRTLTGSRAIGYFAAALIVVSPASAWWSFSAIGMLGFTLAGAAALQHCAACATTRRWPQSVAWGVAGAVLLARTPLHYQPWGIVLIVPILLATVIGLAADRTHRRTNLVAIGTTAVAAGLLLGGVLLENWSSITASLGTVYPGSRVSSGGPKGLQEIFAATSLGHLRDATVTDSNASEISSSFAVSAVWVVLLLAHGVRYRDQAHRAATVTMVAATGFWFSWALVDFGGLGSHLPIINLVPSGRAADVLGYLGILLACLVLPALADRTRGGFALIAAAVTGLVAAHAGSVLRAINVQGLSVRSIWLSSLLLAIVIFTITYRSRWWVGYVVAVTLGFSMIWNVNPVLFGLGDLRGSPVAQQMLSDGTAARSEHKVWASDHNYVDALLIATGVPSLSGRQMSAPNRAEWAKLDPTGADEQVWNRGASHIEFQWTDAADLTISNPNLDVIRISGSPCIVATRFPELSNVISSHALNSNCLTQVDAFNWGGAKRWVYATTTSAAAEQ